VPCGEDPRRYDLSLSLEETYIIKVIKTTKDAMDKTANNITGEGPGKKVGEIIDEIV